MAAFRPYRNLPAFLALALLFGTGALMASLCAPGVQAEVSHVGDGMSMRAEAACCQDLVEVERCPLEGGISTVEAAACCDAVPSGPSEAVVFQEASLRLGLVSAALVGWLSEPPAPPANPPVLDEGPPVPSVRPHLSFSVLLI